MLLSAHQDALRRQVESLRAWQAQWSHEPGLLGAMDLAQHLGAAADLADAIAAGRPPPVKLDPLPQAPEADELREG